LLYRYGVSLYKGLILVKGTAGNKNILCY